MNSFLEPWRYHFGATVPLGHVLRCQFEDRWTRFHALPKSKRFAQNKFEQRLILKRGKEIGDRLFGQGAEVWLVCCRGEYTPKGHFESLVSDYTLQFQRKYYVLDRDFYDGRYLNIYAKAVRWEAQSFAGLLSDVAADKARALWFSPDTGRVFAPYDGGFDLFLESAFHVGGIERRFHSWMSELESKL